MILVRGGYTKCFGEYKLECSRENPGMPCGLRIDGATRMVGWQGMSLIVAVAEAVEVEDN